MSLSSSGVGQSREEAYGGLVMPAVAERSGRSVRGWRWSTAQESTSPMVRLSASRHQRRWP